MDEKERPGGLTALAVINFIFCLLSVFGCIGFIFAPAYLNNINIAEIPDPEMQEAIIQQQQNYENMSTVTFLLILIPMAITAILLLFSGIGYLKMDGFLGRDLGNLYAALSILTSIVNPFMTNTEINTRVIIYMILGLIYPVITLILLNKNYKHLFAEQPESPPIDSEPLQ